MRTILRVAAAALMMLALSCSRTPLSPTAAASTGDNGTLDVGAVGASLRVVSDNVTHDLTGGDGRWSLAPGAYRIEAVQISRTDADGREWLIFGSGDRDAKDFQITAAWVTRVKMGPPIIMGGSVAQADNDLTISLDVRGQGGERYAAAGILDGNLRGAPNVKISNDLGEELDSGQFQYG